MPRANSPSASGSAFPRAPFAPGTDRTASFARVRHPRVGRCERRTRKRRGASKNARARASVGGSSRCSAIEHPGHCSKCGRSQRERAVLGRRVGSPIGPIGGGGGFSVLPPDVGARPETVAAAVPEPRRVARALSARSAAVGTPRLDAVAIVPEVREGSVALLRPSARELTRKCAFSEAQRRPRPRSGILRSSPASLLAALVSRAAHGGVGPWRHHGVRHELVRALPAGPHPGCRASAGGPRLIRGTRSSPGPARTSFGGPIVVFLLLLAPFLFLPFVLFLPLVLTGVLDARGGVVRAPVVPAVQAGALHGSPPRSRRRIHGTLLLLKEDCVVRLPRRTSRSGSAVRTQTRSAARTCASSCGTGFMEQWTGRSPPRKRRR